MIIKLLINIFVAIIFFSCKEPLNFPYKEIDPKKKILYSVLTDEPRTLDPVKATDSISITILSNITATAYEYDYKARPLQIKPLLATSMPIIKKINYKNQTMYSFSFQLKEAYYYNEICLGKKTRKILVDDFILTLKRTANRKLNPFAFPILENIVGFNEYSQKLERIAKDKESINFYQEDIEGVIKKSDTELEILLKVPDPRIQYFFAMTASSPISKECIEYAEKNPDFILDHNPISSGAFFLYKWEKNQNLILKKNPYYYEINEYFSEPLPRIDEVYFSVIRSAPTIWTLFRQGYIDRIGLNQDTMQQVLDGNVLSEKYQKLGIKLNSAKEPVTYGWVFNLENSLFKENIYLRRAIACAIDVEEMIYRFFKNRAIPANGLIPPELEGNLEGDPLIKKYPIRNCKDQVQKNLEKAGFPKGKDNKNKTNLVVRLTAVAGGSNALYQFYTESLAKYGIRLEVDLYDAPTFFEKRHKREFQIAGWGWGADYPDPQNFFQLFYSKNIDTGYNESGYKNPEFDFYYEQLLITSDKSERKKIIYKLNEFLLRDLPVVFTFHPITFSIQWPWVEEIIPHPLDLNQLKYRKIDPEMRFKKWIEINSFLK